MHLLRRQKQYVHERGVDILAGDEICRRRQEPDVLGRQVVAEIHRALGQGELREIAMSTRIGVLADEIQEMHAVEPQESFHEPG